MCSSPMLDVFPFSLEAPQVLTVRLHVFLSLPCPWFCLLFFKLVGSMILYLFFIDDLFCKSWVVHYKHVAEGINLTLFLVPISFSGCL